MTFVEANAEELPFADGASTPIRSPSASATCRASRRRSPRPFACSGGAGGSCAWSSRRSTCRFSTGLYDAYSFSAIPAIGKVVAGDGAPYRYLVESIRKFPDGRTFRRHDRRGRLLPRRATPPYRRHGRHPFGLEALIDVGPHGGRPPPAARARRFRAGARGRVRRRRPGLVRRPARACRWRSPT